MPEFMLLKEIGLTKFKILMSLDYGSDGNIEAHEFYDGKFWCEMPSDLIFANTFCDESTQEEWNIFTEEIVHMIENKEFLEKIKKLRNINDSFYEEDINIVLVEKD